MEDQTLNPFRAPAAAGRAPSPQADLRAVILPPARWSRELPICLGLAAIILVAYWGVWTYDFVYFDDPGYVTDNLNVVRGLPLFKNFNDFRASVYWAFTAFEQSNWHPLTWLSHMLDVQLYGLNAGGHHVTNLILHLGNTLLLFWLLLRLTGRGWCSAAVAALFAVHPMHVESVVWVAERKDVLSTFLGLATMHVYVSYSRKARVDGESLVFSVSLAACIGILGWLWYHQCFWYQQQALWFQQLALLFHQLAPKPSPNVYDWYQQQCIWLQQHGVWSSPDAPDWYRQQSLWLEQHNLKSLPVAYDSFPLVGRGLAVFAALFLLAVGAAGKYAFSSGRTSLANYCGVLLVFFLIAVGMLGGFWFWRAFEGDVAHRWCSWFGCGAMLAGIAGGAVAVSQRRHALAIQCGIFVACLAVLVGLLNWIQLLPQQPEHLAWYDSPFQAIMERMWCAEFAVALFVVFGSLAVDAIFNRRSNLGLFCVVFLLYMLGLLAKPMLVTLPFVLLLIDFWPLGRIFESGDQNEDLPQGGCRKIESPPSQAQPEAAAGGRSQDIVFVGAAPAGVYAGCKPRGLAGRGKVAAVRLGGCLQRGYAHRPDPRRLDGFRVGTVSRLPRRERFAVVYEVHHPDVLAGQDVRAVPPGHEKRRPRLYGIRRRCALAGFRPGDLGCLPGRRYLAVGWFWYVGTLVPVIGLVQVGEQTHADRYTYVPYIGLFIMLAWGVADLIGLVPQIRRRLQFATGLSMALLLTVCVGWTKCQLKFWTDVETHLRHALTITPDNWNMLNNLGVKLWKRAQDADIEAGKAEAAGDAKTAKEFRQKAVALKADAKAQWIHGITQRPTATDIHSNLGYMYSEANDLDKAEWHLTRAVELKPISPRPRNNLGRVLLRRSQQCEADAGAAEAKGKTDPAQAARAKQLSSEAKAKLNQAIQQFEEAVRLDPSLLEARLNLGEVYYSLGVRDKAEGNLDQAGKDLDKAEFHYLEILKLRSESVTDRETIGNFSQAYYGLARIAIARNRLNEAIDYLQKSIELNPQNISALQLLAIQRFERGEYRQGESCLWPLLAMLPPAQRRSGGAIWRTVQGRRQTQGSGARLELHGLGLCHESQPRLLDPQAAMVLAQRVVEITKRQDPLALDVLAAAQAANKQYGPAVQTAQAAIQLASAQGNRPQANAVARRLPFYQQGKPYQCDPSGSDRP